MSPRSELPTGQVLTGSAPVRRLLDHCAALPLPTDAVRAPGCRRGVGYALGFKNVAYSEGFDDAAEATVTLAPSPDGPVATIRTAAVDYGQGLYTVLAQIARTELGVERVVVEQPSTASGSAGSTSASRQTTMSGGAVLGACCAIADALGGRELTEPVTRTFTYHHRPTTPLDEDGQGSPHVSFAFVAERAVVDVDLELGLVQVVEVAVVQDAGRVLNPLAAEGQVEGGVAQGLGLALTEELQLADGVMQNASFSDYLIPTIADVPPIVVRFVEDPEPFAPYGVKGIGELATVAATAAVVAAVRDASGRPLHRAPVRPDDLVGAGRPAVPARAPVPDVPGQEAIPQYLGLGLGQQKLMKAR